MIIYLQKENTKTVFLITAIFADSNLSEFKFIDCTFNSCDFSLAKLNKIAFPDVAFNDCKMLAFSLTNVTLLDFRLRFKVASSIIPRFLPQSLKEQFSETVS